MTLFDFINESPWWSLVFIFAIAYCVEALNELLNALKKRCYILSESHLSGYRLILGFNTLDDVQGAHQQIVKSRAIRPREVQPPKNEG